MKLAAVFKQTVIVPVLIMMLQACIIAPPIEEQSDDNIAPVVDESLIAPAPYSGYLVDSGGQPFNVDGAFTDPDNDELYFYWYFHDQKQEYDYLVSVDKKLFKFNPCKPFTIEHDTNGIIHLVVSDGAYGDNSTGIYDFPAGTSHISVFWMVKIETAGGCQ